MCTTVKDKTSADMVQVKATVQRVSIIVIVLASMILVGMTVLIGTGIDRTVMLFRQALDKITQGQISVRIKADGRDEFSQFGRSLNVFLDKLEGSITHLQESQQILRRQAANLNRRQTGRKGRRRW